jgi:hypothetical protein
MSDIIDHLLAHVRDLLRQHPPFRGMTRDDIDNGVIAALESSIRRDLEHWIAATADEIRSEIEADLEFAAEMEAAAKKAKRAKPQHTQKQEERHGHHHQS